MRPFLFSVGAGLLALSAAWAQAPSGSGASAPANTPQIPFGQTYKDFQFPLYQNGHLAYTLSAVSATGKTTNRAETTDLRIDIYTDDKVTTTITSPKADLYIAERVMRTKNTVQIERADMEATAQTCDFDLNAKKYLLRENVKVILKHFDAGGAPKKAASAQAQSSSPDAGAPSAPTPGPEPDAPLNPRGVPNNQSLLDMPGSYANTNVAPIPPPTTVAP
jgi:hypothetical protein